MVIGAADSRTRDRVRRFPIDSKLGNAEIDVLPDPVGVLESLDLDGSTEYVKNNTAQDIGIGANWTIAFWFYKSANFTANKFVIRINPASGSNNDIRIETTNATQGRLDVTVFDSTAANNHFVRHDSTWTNGAWHHIVITHASGKTEVFKNGTSVASDTSPTVTMTNTNRKIIAGDGWVGYAHSLAIWDVVLSGNNITAIYNSGDGTNFDLRENSGNYDQSANLQHWWVFGADDSSDSAMGTDWASATDINIMDDAANVTTADLIVASPT